MSLRSRLSAIAATGALVLAPAAAFAHPGHGEAAGFAHGFVHPATGIDHVLAMVLVGAFAWQRGGAAQWCLPLAFVALMAAGGALGMAGIGIPHVELGIALSVAVLGAAVAFAVKAPVPAALAVIGVFALAHGHAHGVEMPEAVGGVAYGVGFVAATLLLHAAGIAGGAALGRFRDGVALRAAGGLAGVVGLALVAGLSGLP